VLLCGQRFEAEPGRLPVCPVCVELIKAMAEHDRCV